MSTDIAFETTTRLRAVARWLADDVPGPADWVGRSLEVRPTVDGVVARCSTIGPGGGDSVPWVLPPEHGIAVEVTALQDAMASPEGTWVSAVIDVDPGGQAYCRPDPWGAPAELVPGRAITADELRAHLRTHPRRSLEPWMADLLTADAEREQPRAI